jgi:GTPase Era involved in 16S rRNA processing
MIWNAIAPRAAHQQRVENLVQMAGFLGKTHVEEARRSARAKIHCIYQRDFNTWALNIMRQCDEKKLLAKIQQQMTQQPNSSANTQQTKKIKQQLKHYKVEGADRLELFAKWIDLKSKEIAEAEAYLSDEKKQQIMKEMTREGKISRLENEEKEKRFNPLLLGGGTLLI